MAAPALSDDIWTHVRPLAVMITSRPPQPGTDPVPYVILEANCDWEDEHGLQLVWKEGRDLVRVGEYDGKPLHAESAPSGVVYHSTYDDGFSTYRPHSRNIRDHSPDVLAPLDGACNDAKSFDLTDNVHPGRQLVTADWLCPAFSMPMIQIAPGFAMSNLNRELLDRRNAAQNEDGTISSDPPALSQLDRSVLRFTPDQARRAENMQEFLGRIRESDPEGTAKLEPVFASTDVMDMIADAMAPMGLDPNNVADAYTVWWISSYQASQGSVKTPSHQRYEAVRQQSESVLLSSGTMTIATEAEKQQFAGAYLIQAALIDSSVQEMQPNPAQMDALKTAVKQGALASGPDLDRMILTDEGLLAN